MPTPSWPGMKGGFGFDRPVAVCRVDVGVAQPRRFDSDEHLAVPRTGDLHVLNAKGLAELVDDCCFHGAPPVWWAGAGSRDGFEAERHNRPARGGPVVSLAGICRGQAVTSVAPLRVGARRAPGVVGPPGVDDPEEDEQGHEAGEDERRDRTPKGDFSEDAEAVRLEQQATKRGALEHRLHLAPQPRCIAANPWAGPWRPRSAGRRSSRHRSPAGARR